MATTQAEAAVMHATAGKFDQANASLQRMLSKLMGELDALRTQWQGAGGRSFEQVKQAWAEDQKTLSDTLAETAAAMRSAGQHYTTSDTAASARLAPRSRMDLPL